MHSQSTNSPTTKKPFRWCFRSLLCGLLAIFGSALRVSAQQSIAPPTNGSIQLPSSPGAGTTAVEDSLLQQALRLTPAEVQARLASTESNASLSDEVKSDLRHSFERALENLKQHAEVEQQTATYKGEMEDRDKLIEEISAQLEQPAPPPEPNLPEDATLAQLETLRLAEQEQLDNVTRNLEAWESRARARSERRPQMPNLIEEARIAMESAAQDLATPLPEDTEPAARLALRTERESVLALRSAQVELVRVEQAWYEALADLFPLQRDLLARTKNSLDKRLQRWNELLANARQQEVASQEMEAQRQLELAHPSLRELAERNSQLAERRSELQTELQSWTAELSDIDRIYGDLDSKFRDIQEQKKLLGLTTVIGLELRSQRNELPNIRKYQRRVRSTESEVRKLHTERIKLDAERRQLVDIDAHVETILQQVLSGDSGLAPSEVENLQGKAREYFIRQRSYLDELLKDLESGVGILSRLDIAGRRLIERTVEYRNFIDEQVLWIRSSDPIDINFPAQAVQAVLRIGSVPQWMPTVAFIQQDFNDFSTLYLVALLLVGVLIFFGSRQRELIAKLHRHAQGYLNIGIGPNLLAIGLTVLLGLTWAIPPGFIAWRLSRSEINLALAVSGGLTSSALLLWVMMSLRRLCVLGGVAELFLQWPADVLKCIRNAAWWYVLGGVPLVYLFVAANRLDDPAQMETLGRLALILFCLLVSGILVRVLRPSGVILTALLRSQPNSRVFKNRWFWYLPLVTAPLALAGLALAGYQYTAEQLIIRYQLTLLLSVGLLLAYATSLQWLYTARRRLALNQARARREAERESERADSDGESGLLPNALEVESGLIDVSQINRQVLQLANGTVLLLFLFGCWAIWIQVLPALQVISRIELWNTQRLTSELTETVAGTPTLREVTQIVPTTLGHLLWAVVLIATAALASRTLPSLLAVSLLPRLPIDKGTRDAVILLTGYGLAIGGLIVASSIIGIQWSNIQWLVAALTVGLGFGLQEIFANFVSGIIILFERPVRLGDVVTIDGISGTVTQIRIRATTITDWDRKEYIVPNKEFIAGKLLNWTRTDRTNRLVIKVGIAFGSDVQQALGILKEVADTHPLVLTEPPPLSTFEEFGDNALQLVLRCFLASLDQRLNVLTQLNSEIINRFRAAGIEIPFPQRDLHVRSLPSQWRSVDS